MVEGARLESVFRGNSNEGSNPSLSATFPQSMRVVLPEQSLPAKLTLNPEFRMSVLRLLHVERGLAVGASARRHHDPPASDRLKAANDKIGEWFRAGVELAWLIDGDDKTVYICREANRHHHAVRRGTSVRV